MKRIHFILLLVCLRACVCVCMHTLSVYDVQVHSNIYTYIYIYIHLCVWHEQRRKYLNQIKYPTISNSYSFYSHWFMAYTLHESFLFIAISRWVSACLFYFHSFSATFVAATIATERCYIYSDDIVHIYIYDTLRYDMMLRMTILFHSISFGRIYRSDFFNLTFLIREIWYAIVNDDWLFFSPFFHSFIHSFFMYTSIFIDCNCCSSLTINLDYIFMTDDVCNVKNYG